jgi:hypothetical protein
MTFLTRLWRTDPWLTGTAFAMLALVPLLLAGLLLDPRLVTAAPVWLKPLKFAMSIAAYTLTLAWVFTWLPEWRRTRAIVGRATAVALLVEMVLIAGQAWRGTASHFNTATPFDAAVFGVMGVVIMLQTAVTIAVAVAVWRQRFADPALGWALRVGVVLTLAGALVGPLMTRPTPAQRARAAEAAGRMPIAGAHTVGAPDGGPGLPVTGWSTSHGDLRVPHFVGLHAWQALPLFVAVALRGRSERTRVRLALAAGVAYAALFAALLLQALRGMPLLSVP